MSEALVDYYKGRVSELAEEVGYLRETLNQTKVNQMLLQPRSDTGSARARRVAEAIQKVERALAYQRPDAA